MKRFFTSLIILAGLAGGAMPAQAATDVQRVVSDKGIEAWLIQDDAVPVVALSFAFEGGSEVDPADKAGLSRMVMGLLDEGAGDMSDAEYQKRLADLSISLGFSAGRDRLQGGLYTLSENADEAAEMLHLALSEPRFDERVVERVRDQMRRSIVAQSEDPTLTAYRAFFEAIFPGHPYGTSTRGTLESVAAITRDDLATFVENRFARDNLIIGVAGDIAAEDVGPMVDRIFADLPDEADLPEVEEAEIADGRLVVVERSVPQSVVVFGQKGVKRSDPDWMAANLINYILGGGGFQSRLMQEVRVERGLAYGASSSLVPMDEAALVIGQVATENERVGESLSVIRDSWRRMAEDGPTEAELEAAKLYTIGSFPLSLDSTGSLADLLVTLQAYDLGIDYLDRRAEEIEAVTIEDARRVAGELLDPDALTAVVVGQPVGVEPTRVVPEEDEG